MPVLEIDRKFTEVEKGTNLILAARKAGVTIPHYCYHPRLKVVAQCRLCLVKIEGIPRLQPACNTKVEKDMRVSTTDEEVLRTRKLILELLLRKHPLDCPVCPKAGECLLQDFVYAWGPEAVRRAKKPSREIIRLSDKLLLFRERCILCTRCARFLEEIGTGGISILFKSNKASVSIYPGHLLSSLYSGNLVDICPVGAIVDEATIFMPRRLEKTQTACPLCERVCKIYVYSWMDTIITIKSEDMICDEGRWGWKKLERKSKDFLEEGKTIEAKDFVKAVVKLLKDGGKKALLVTPFATCEETNLLREIANKLEAEISLIPPRTDEGDNILLRPVRAPKSNVDVKEEVLRKAKDGKFDVVLSYSMGTYFEAKGREIVIDLSPHGTFFMPASSPYEKTGTYVNFEGSPRTLRRCIRREIPDEIEIFSEVLRNLN